MKLNNLVKHGVNFLFSGFKTYNYDLYTVLVKGIYRNNSVISDSTGEISYKYLSQVIVLFFNILLVYFLWSDFGISFNSLFFFYYVLIVTISFSSTIFSALGVRDGNYPGIVNTKSVIVLFFSIIVSVSAAYYVGMLTDWSYFLKVVGYIILYFYTYYYVFFLLHLIIYSMWIDSNFDKDFGKPFKEYFSNTNIYLLALDSIGIPFMIVSIYNIYSNVKNFGINFSDWIFYYEDFIYVFKLFSLSFFILVFSIIVVISIRFLSLPRYEFLGDLLYSLLSILGVFIYMYGVVALLCLFIILITYLILYYIIDKIILDYLKTYKYLRWCLHLTMFLMYLSILYSIFYI